MLLWSTAPLQVHDIVDKILRDGQRAEWLSCGITADRAIFDARQSSRRIMIEYKYELTITEPKDYVQPFKRHFRLLWDEGNWPAPGNPLFKLASLPKVHWTAHTMLSYYFTFDGFCLCNRSLEMDAD